jgi:outer membrane lipoprotein-sorting protein
MTCSSVCARSSFLLVLLASAPAWAEGPSAHGGKEGKQPAASAPDAATSSGPANAQATVDVASLLTAFAKMSGLEASFEEEKHIALLAKPLTSRGRLFFTPPGLLLRRIEAPTRSEVMISKDSVRVRDQAGEQTLDLRTRKDIRPFVESLTWILAGDRAALEKVYAIGFQAERAGAPWLLSLKPKVAPLSQLIAELQIRGHGMFVEQIEVRETGGDKTVTRIVSANPKRRFSERERAQLFGVEAQDADKSRAAPKPPGKAARPTP